MTEYLVTLQYPRSTVYVTYIVQAKSEEWIEKNIAHIESKCDVYGDDIEYGAPNIFEVQENT